MKSKGDVDLGIACIMQALWPLLSLQLSQWLHKRIEICGTVHLRALDVEEQASNTTLCVHPERRYTFANPLSLNCALCDACAIPLSSVDLPQVNSLKFCKQFF